MCPSLPKEDIVTEVIKKINDKKHKPSMNKKSFIQFVNISTKLT